MQLRVLTWGEGTLPNALAMVLVAMLVASRALAQPESPDESRNIQFSIPSGTLMDALDAFSEQSGLQIIYDQKVTAGRQAASVNGSMAPARALDRLLMRSGAVWEFVNDRTVFVHRATDSKTASRDLADARATLGHAPPLDSERVVTLEEIKVFGDPRRVLPNEASTSAFGFNKPALDTPRAVSFISDETMQLFGLSAVEDLVRVVPGTFTTTRFGIQGSIDVRNVPADFFIRGMKRLSLQGHARSVLAAMDTIEIVRGPPSPIFGMGKIGGYVNAVPAAGRAKTGGYLTDPQGFVQGITGAYDRNEWSFGLGGPADFLSKQGGYYLYGLHEDSGSFTHGVPVRQDVAQGALSVDRFIGPFRLETGANYQRSETAGALTGRLTQDLVDHNRYIRGSPLVNLDQNGNGVIGYLEMQNASPVQGRLSAGNQPLVQYFDWPRDASGKPLPLDQFPKVKGIPKSLYDYLVVHPEADPTGALRAQGVGGPVPTSGYVPIGMALDPRTVGFDTLDLRRATAFERDLQANLLTGYIDLLYDTDPDFTVRNQLFYDSMDQFKVSNQPLGQRQWVYVWEDKFTVTKRFSRLPSWLRLESLASLNFRDTVADGKFVLVGDFSTHRTDAMAPGWSPGNEGMTANTTFASPIDNPDIQNDGAPWTSIYATRFWEIGAGVLFNIDLFQRTNLTLGGRFDGSQARNRDFSVLNVNTGTSANPGAYTTEATTRGWDQGVSWNASVTQALARDIRAYFTMSHASIALDANNNALTSAVIRNGHIGGAELKEVGIKASLLGNRLFFTAAGFEQSRLMAADEDPAVVATTYATSTATRGLELEIKWVPLRNMFASVYATHQRTTFDPNIGGALLVDARTLGFQDVLDASGKVIYPAEAFMYGGRTRIVLPDNVPGFETKQGNPETQFGMSAHYRFNTGIGFTFSGNYFSSTCSGRICAVTLPAATVLNAGGFWERDPWSLKLDVLNFTNERWFRARSGDALGDPLAQAMPDRRWQLTLRFTF
ncbi:MAG: TonB-dependent receptor plug domain-containing protein [Gammaproteobacteria bacterium]